MNQIVRAEDDTAATTPCPKFDLEFVAATSNGGDSENKFELIKREKIQKNRSAASLPSTETTVKYI